MTTSFQIIHKALFASQLDILRRIISDNDNWTETVKVFVVFTFVHTYMLPIFKEKFYILVCNDV
jgi:hypothetical protein